MSGYQINEQSGLIVPTVDSAITLAGSDFAGIDIHSPEIVAVRFQKACLDGFNRCEKVMLTAIADLQAGTVSLTDTLPKRASVESLAQYCMLLDTKDSSVQDEVQKLITAVELPLTLIDQFDVTTSSTADIRAFKTELPDVALAFRSLARHPQILAPTPAEDLLNDDLVANAYKNARQSATTMSFILDTVRSCLDPNSLTRLVGEVKQSIENTLASVDFLCHPMVPTANQGTLSLYRNCHQTKNACDGWEPTSIADVLNIRTFTRRLLDSTIRFLNGK